MKVFDSNKLTHTLQTWCGMVLCDGQPQQRHSTNLPKYVTDNEQLSVNTAASCQLPEKTLVEAFILCVLECRLPRFSSRALGCRIPIFLSSKRTSVEDMDRLHSNIHACCDTSVDTNFMKRNVVSLNRLDLEQAAAVMIAAIRNDDSITKRAEIVAALVRELDPYLITQSCMWLEESQRKPGATVEEAKFSRLVHLLRRMLRGRAVQTEGTQIIDGNDVQDWASLLPLLLRVRRCKPGELRCLYIPQWVFEAAGTKPPAHVAACIEQGLLLPGREPMLEGESGMDKIVLSRKQFRSLQRRLLRFFRFWEPEIRLRKDIKDLEANVIYSAKHIKSMVTASESTLVVAHYFFALQRRLQRKVVSDLQWTGFLAKGESCTILQNNPNIPTTFEQRLSAFSGQTGVPLIEPVLPQIDRCCNLMKDYVEVHGKGDYNNLTFVPGVRGGSGRGPVDEYNLLCDILRTLNKAAKEQDLPHPEVVHKFLAKDIMAWNRSFEDDAFANGKVPGWETWLARRKEDGVSQGVKNLVLSDDMEGIEQ